MGTTVSRLRPPTKSVEFEPIFADYIGRLVRRNRAKATVRNCTDALGHFQEWLIGQGVTAAQVTEDDLYAYFGRGVFAPSTNDLHVGQVKAAYNYGLRRGVISADPFVDFEAPKVPEPEPAAKIIPNAELRAMHERCMTPKQELFWALLTFTGMRRDEIRRLTWEQLDMATWSFSIIGKGGKRRVVPVHPFLQELLWKDNESCLRLFGHPLTGSIINPHRGHPHFSDGHPYAEGTNFVRLAGHFTDRPFHSFRKTLATTLARNGVEESVIKKIFGWSPSGMFQRYYDGTQYDVLALAIRKAYIDDPVA